MPPWHKKIIDIFKNVQENYDSFYIFVPGSFFQLWISWKKGTAGPNISYAIQDMRLKDPNLPKVTPTFAKSERKQAMINL
jgi:hypothetical protein